MMYFFGCAFKELFVLFFMITVVLYWLQGVAVSPVEDMLARLLLLPPCGRYLRELIVTL